MRTQNRGNYINLTLICRFCFCLESVSFVLGNSLPPILWLFLVFSQQVSLGIGADLCNLSSVSHLNGLNGFLLFWNDSVSTLWLRHLFKQTNRFSNSFNSEQSYLQTIQSALSLSQINRRERSLEINPYISIRSTVEISTLPMLFQTNT